VGVAAAEEALEAVDIAVDIAEAGHAVAADVAEAGERAVSAAEVAGVAVGDVAAEQGAED